VIFSKMNQKVNIQPLRIPTGWQISWNRFYEIDPPEIMTADYRDYFDEDMFFAMYYSLEMGKRIGLDLGWGYKNEGGSYILSVVHYTEIKFKESHKKVIKIRKEGQTLNYRLEPNFLNDPSNWETPILTTRSRTEVAEKMDEIFYDVGMRPNSKYWKK
jgi:hypothetical protein